MAITSSFLDGRRRTGSCAASFTGFIGIVDFVWRFLVCQRFSFWCRHGWGEYFSLVALMIAVSRVVWFRGVLLGVAMTI